MTSSPSTNGRTGNGRFAKGNAGGPGNPYARRVARLRSLILESVSDDDMQAIVGVLVQQAKAGDLSAIRELFLRLVGKPAESPEPDRADLDGMELDWQRHKAEEREDTRKLYEGLGL